MYGMIHQAARAMSIELFGESAWRDILAASELGDNDFLSASLYGDDKTLALVAAIAARANLPVDEALGAFGRYWIKYTEQSSFGSLMQMSGGNLQEFLANLDRMHVAIQTAMPAARMPSFQVVSSTQDRIEVDYISDRTGLEPFVHGLLEGLIDKFKQPGVVLCDTSGEHPTFSIEFADAA